MDVSVIMTVYNEVDSIERLFASLAEQSRRPAEIVICDGGSTDGTVEVIHAQAAHHAQRLPPVRVLVEPGANISRGRNLAIAAATGPLIASTDAGVRLSPEWLENLIAPWQRESGADAHASHIRHHSSLINSPLAVAGFFLPDVDGVFTTAMAATVLPLVEEIDPQRFLPSSRSVAFTKDAWERAGGYPEWLDYCEDLLFDFAINAQQPDQPTTFVWAPGALVYFRPRSTLRSFWTQYYRYARGDGKADLWRKRHLIRYTTYLLAIPALLGHGLWGSFARGLGWLGLGIGIFLYCRRPWQRLQVVGAKLTPPQRIQAAVLVPLIRMVGDVAKMAGYPVGLWWRWRNRWRSEIDWRKRIYGENKHCPS